MNSGIPLRSRHGQHFIKMYFKMSSTQSKSKSFSRYVQCKAKKKKKKGISVRQSSPARVPRQRASTHTHTHSHTSGRSYCCQTDTSREMPQVQPSFVSSRT